MKLFGEPLILLSDRIRPYIELSESLEKCLNKSIVIRYADDNPKDIFIYNPWFILGNKAFDFVLPFSNGRKIYFSLVENPDDKIQGKKAIFEGFRMEFSPREIAKKLKKVLDTKKDISIGIPFDPQKNYYYVKKLYRRMSKFFHIIEIPVSSDRELVGSMEKVWNKLDFVLLIPDSTVINDGNINYIFSNGLSKNVGIIGYNKWFVKRGAIFSYFIDFHEMGKELCSLYKNGKLNGISYYSNIRLIGNKTLLEKYKLVKSEGIDLIWQPN
jgi:hypothetical protein